MDENVTFDEKVQWTLQQKVSHALFVIDEFYHHYDGECYISFSGGKDSCLLKFLCDKFTDMAGYPRMKVVFNNTTNEHREILDFVKSFGEEIIWLRPKITFAESLKKNGYPLVSKEQAQYIREAKTTKSDKLRNLRMFGRGGKKGRQGMISEKWQYLVYEDIKITEKCCQVLKKDPAIKFEKETGLKPILGVTAGEGTLRLQQARMHKCNIFGDRPKSKPLNVFTEENVWDMILSNKIPYCTIYDDQTIEGKIISGEKRTGCAYCAFGVQFDHPSNTKFHRLYYRDRKRYKSIMDKLGYRNALHKIGIVLPDDEGSQQTLL